MKVNHLTRPSCQKDCLKFDLHPISAPTSSHSVTELERSRSWRGEEGKRVEDREQSGKGRERERWRDRERQRGRGREKERQRWRQRDTERP